MRWKSSADSYGGVAISIHWLTAAAILGVLGTGLSLDSASEESEIGILRVHVIFGITVFALTVLRILWWLFADRRPREAPNQPRWQAAVAWSVHRLLYLVILFMGASGIAMIALSGAGNILFGGQPGPLPNFFDYPPRGPHGLGAWLLMALLALHIGAALYHQFILRDRLLGRMGVGRRA